MRPTLRRARDFELAYTQGRKVTCSILVLFHLGNAADARVGFVASRKVGNAVARNRAKRLMRAAFAAVDSPRRPLPGWFVLVARREILGLKSTEVCEQLERMLGTWSGGDRATRS